MNVNEFVNNLVELWNKGEMNTVAYQISNIYASNDYGLINIIMTEFKERVTA